MRPIALAATCVTLIAAATGPGTAAGRYDVALAPAKQAAHVLNRAAFGPRPSDLADIRRVGVERWIRQQLEPATIPDSAVLTTRLTPLQSQKLATWQIFEVYQPAQPQVRFIQPNITQLISPDQNRRLQTGSPEERRAILDGLTPELRQQVLAVVPVNIFDALPELRQQADSVFALVDVEVIEPEVHEDFFELSRRVHRALQLRFDKLRDNRLSWIECGHGFAFEGVGH